MSQLFIPTASDIIVQNAFLFFFFVVVVPRMFEYYIGVYLCGFRVYTSAGGGGGCRGGGRGLGFSTTSFVSVVSHQRSDGNAENM